MLTGWIIFGNIDIDMLVTGEVILINTMFESSKKKMDLKLEDIYNEKAKFKLEKNYMIINIVADMADVEIEGTKVEAASVDMPVIKYIFK